MKLPPGLLNTNGDSAKGAVVISSHLRDSEDLQEYGKEFSGNMSSCYVLTAPGDLIDVSYAFNPHVADFVDIIVDGVRRKTFSSSAPGVAFRGTFDRVLHMGRAKATKRAGLKHCRMQVKTRNQSQDIIVDDDDLDISSVGSVTLQVFQKKNSTDSDSGTEDQDEPAARYPDFEELAEWHETRNHDKFHELNRPSFQIEYIEPTKGHKILKDKVQKTYSGKYQLLATMVFNLRSTSELRSMGKFKDVPDYVAPPYVPPASAAPTEKKGKGKAKKTDEKEDSEEPADFDALEADEQRGESSTSRGKAPKKTLDKPNGSKTSSKKIDTPQSKTDAPYTTARKTLPSSILTEATFSKKPAGNVDENLIGDQTVVKFESNDDLDIYSTNDPHGNKTIRISSDDTVTASEHGIVPMDQNEVPAASGEKSQEDFGDNYMEIGQKSRLQQNQFSSLSSIKGRASLAGLPEAPAYHAWLKRDRGEGLASLSSSHLDDNRTEREHSVVSDGGTVSTELAPLEDVLAATRASSRQDLTTAAAGNNDVADLHRGSPVFESRSSKTGSSLSFLDKGERSVAMLSEFTSSKQGAPHQPGQSQISTQSADSQHLLPAVATMFEPPVKNSFASVEVPVNAQLNKSLLTSSGLQTEKRNSSSLKRASSIFTPKAKRKIERISGATDYESEARKAISSPAYRSTAIENDVSNATARIQAAEEKKSRLQEEYKKALLIKEERDKAQKMLDTADQMERENAELEERIAAMLNHSN